MLFNPIVDGMSRVIVDTSVHGGSVALARYVVDAVVLEGRGVREVARTHGVSKSSVSVLVARYRAGGYEALELRTDEHWSKLMVNKLARMIGRPPL